MYLAILALHIDENDDTLLGRVTRLRLKIDFILFWNFLKDIHVAHLMTFISSIGSLE